MSKKSIGHKKVICQCLSILPTDEFACPLLNYDYDKLSVDSLLKIFVAAQIGKWESYADIEEKIRSDKKLREALNLPSISGSQLSRRINELPTEIAQSFFLKVVYILRDLTKNYKGIDSTIGKLSIVDSTHIKLPPQLCDWAYVTKGWNVVKMHTRLVVLSENVSFPDKILPSTGNVSDFESTDVLIEKSDTTYVMDRGYPSNKNLNDWLEQEIHFVVRLSKNFKFVARENYNITNSVVQKDCKILVYPSKRPARLVEFIDEDGKLYRLLTTRFDLTADEIMDIYRYRWMIETFFKWIKQHLRIIKIWSTKPQGMWNQMFIALAAYCLSLIVQIKSKTKKTLWGVLRALRTYMFKTWASFLKELHPKKMKTSKGRQKIPIVKEKQDIFVGTIARIKPQKRK
ncbi:IS4 family transposase [Bacillus andreraoultii]|uniref:IS4 family transposase n=1 Tax=Bacillus andreraoultii TaxID=1499685 RepID=UPI000539604A|nr:IS4 family transposase [Bacillus andreraoultii]